MWVQEMTSTQLLFKIRSETVVLQSLATMSDRKSAEDHFNETNCLVCLESFTDPVTIDCRHRFCRDCLTWWESNVNASCPQCGETFQAAIQRQHPARNMFMFASLSALLLMSGMLLSWKNIQDSSYELALYGTKQPSDPGKPKENQFNWVLSLLESFFHPEELSLHGLLRTRKRLQETGQLSALLDKCFIYAMEAFDHETHSLKENAKLTLHCDGTFLVFVCGKGENEMAIFDFDGEIYYKAKTSSWQTFFMRVFRRYPW